MPISGVILKAVLFFISVFSFKKYFLLERKIRFLRILLFSHLFLVSTVTIAILITFGFTWILFAGYELPLNWFPFLENPLLIRVVEVLSDTIFALILIDSIMKVFFRLCVYDIFISQKLAEDFGRENKWLEFKKFAFSRNLILIILWKEG